MTTFNSLQVNRRLQSVFEDNNPGSGIDNPGSGIDNPGSGIENLGCGNDVAGSGIDTSRDRITSQQVLNLFCCAIMRFHLLIFF